jgi:hypothetical protein
MRVRGRLTNESHLIRPVMGPQNWFALAVRVVGLMTLMTGLATLLDGFLLKLGYFTHLESSPAYYLIFGVANLIGGLCLILGAPVVARFAYPREDEDQDEGNEDQD